MRRATSLKPSTRPRWGSTPALATALLCVASPLGALAATSPPLAFKGASLGMSLEAWRAMPPPGKLTPNVQATCSSDTNAAGSGLAPTPEQRKAGVVLCAYLSRYGRFSFPEHFALDDHYRTTRLRYVFKDDRLIEIRCRAPVGAYLPLEARLKARYGPTGKLVRDRVSTSAGSLPRVTQTWSMAQGSVELTDPVPPFSDLGLRFVASGTPPPAGSPAHG
jgi:hypothetical protein